MSKAAGGRYSLRERKPASSKEAHNRSAPPTDDNRIPETAVGKPATKNNAVPPVTTESFEVKLLPAKKAGPTKSITRKRKRSTLADAEKVSDQMDEKQEPLVDPTASPSQLDLFDRQTFSHFLHQIERFNSCHVCGRTLLAEPFVDSHIDCWSSVVAIKSGIALTGIPCPSLECNAITCLGCGKQPIMAAGDQSQDVEFCCVQGWYVAVWMLLAYFDSKRGRKLPLDCPSQDVAAQQNLSKHKTKRRTNNPRPPAGTGYAESGFDDEESVSSGSLSQEAHEPSQLFKVIIPESDKRESCVYTLLAGLLRSKPCNPPSWDNNAATRKSKKSRRVPRPAAGLVSSTSPLSSMLQWSQVLKAIAELLRNDSIQEACERLAIYTAALDLVEALANEPETTSLVEDRTVDAFKASSESRRGSLLPLLDFKENPVSDARGLEGISIADSMKGLVVAAEIQLQAASLMPEVFGDLGSKELLGLCRRVERVGGLLGAADQQPAIMLGAKKQIQMPSKFAMVDAIELTPTYRYTSQANFKNGSNNKRMKTLFREIGILRSSLPDGIFVKAANDRPDMLKAVIVGGQETPYAGGLFEFDILCPMEYPGKPPAVHCVTSASSEARQFHINPNLYNTGFVCLSLLGTWQGTANESWQAGRSTLLQVLISIQSMILGTPTPANNEPGGLPVPNKEYNKSVQAGTINSAMLGWLKKDAARNGIWKDLVLAHFKANAQQILATAKTWAEDNPRVSKYVELSAESAAESSDYSMMPETTQHIAEAHVAGMMPHLLSGQGSWSAPPTSTLAATHLNMMPGGLPSHHAFVTGSFVKKAKAKEHEQRAKVVNLLEALEEALQDFL